ncbi:Uncharacterised protein [Streptococcus pneumoniae]|nr:Uncharacterised protein [Streptococcus pneumoniae]
MQNGKYNPSFDMCLIDINKVLFFFFAINGKAVIVFTDDII